MFPSRNWLNKFAHCPRYQSFAIKQCLKDLFRWGLIGASHCIFMLNKNRPKAIILIYMDNSDMVGDEVFFRIVKANLDQQFRLTQFREYNFFLAVCKETERTISLTQKPLIQGIMMPKNIKTSKPVKTQLPIFNVLHVSARLMLNHRTWRKDQ